MPLGPIVAALFLSCVTGKVVPDSEWFQAYLLLLGLDWIVIQNTIFLKITLLFLKSIEQLSNVSLVCLILSQKVVIQHGSVFMSGTECSEMQQGWWLSPRKKHTIPQMNEMQFTLLPESAPFFFERQFKAPVPNSFFFQYIHMPVVQITSQPDHWTLNHCFADRFLR